MVGPAGLVGLWGEDHPDLDRVADAQLDDRAAVALSRGRYPKDYGHVDPNEDAVLAACGPAGWLLAVADGHFGFDAARAALRVVAARAAAMLDGSAAPAKALEDASRAAREAVADAVAGLERPRRDSATALTLALITDGHLHVTTYGDTVCVRGRGGKAKVVGESGPFLDPHANLHPVVRVRMRARDRVVVGSDGLTTYLGHDWPTRAAAVLEEEDQPRDAARRLVELAMTGGAGDHVSVGVLL